MSLSRRKRPTIAWSRLGGIVALALLASCAKSPREPLLTYFNGDHAISVRYPSGWKTEEAEQEGIWYRYFLGPPYGPKRTPEVSVTLLAGPFSGPLEDYAQSYLSGNKLLSSANVERQGVKGRTYEFESADGSTRHALLLLGEDGRVCGLYSQGLTSYFESHRATLSEMARSLTFERPAGYPIRRNDTFMYALRVPQSWREVRTFSAGGTWLIQFNSPALAADPNRDTVHASLSLTVAPLKGGVDLESFYAATRLKAGESFQIFSHSRWRDGYVDYMRSETPITTSRIKRFYRVSQKYGYVLGFEARDDVFSRVARWCDLIASTFQVGPEVGQP